MKTLCLSIGLGLVVAGGAWAQDPGSAASPPLTADTLRPAAEIESLVGPIALYPDALIAIILPASVASTDIVLAARHVREFPNDRSQIESRAWDESVKSLCYYPDVLKWMDENLTWTKQLGETFAQQPADVMQSIQRLRSRARAAGTLVDTPQQQIVAETDVIRIVPAQPDVIYVPRYEADVVFLPQPMYYSRPLFSFGVGVRTGSWLAYECDWRRNTIWVGDRHRAWHRPDWRRPVVSAAPVPPPHVHAWRPPPRVVSSFQRTTVTHRRTDAPRAPIAATPSSPRIPPRSQLEPSRNPPTSGSARSPATAQVGGSGDRRHPARPDTAGSRTRSPAAAPAYAPAPPTPVTVPASPSLSPGRPEGRREHGGSHPARPDFRSRSTPNAPRDTASAAPAHSAPPPSRSAPPPAAQASASGTANEAAPAGRSAPPSNSRGGWNGASRHGDAAPRR